jgi:hypothetical protein
MAVMNRSAVVGVFDTREQAHRAVEELHRAGFSDDQVSMVMHHKDDNTVEITDLDAAKAAQVTGENKGGEGAVIGAVAGGLGGGAVALALGTIPGVGPILSLGSAAAAGIFGAMFGIGAVAGAATGGIVGALVGMDIPEEEARHYEEELKAGRVLVGVKSTDRLTEAESILEQCGASHGLATAVVVEPLNPPPM